MFDDEEEKDNLQTKIIEHLSKKECRLEDGSIVSNLDGICEMLIGKALNGDLQVVQLINQLTSKK